MNSSNRQVLSEDASPDRLGRRAVPGIVAEISQAAKSAVEHLVSSVQNRVVSAAKSLGRMEAGQQ
jgi:hypothetical protein